MNHIEQLNRRLGECLGYIGAEPRFKWAWAPDMEYLYRKPTAITFTRHNWAERLGRVWVLTGFTAPVAYVGEMQVAVTREEWWARTGGQMPFPERGSRQPLADTALPPGVVPNGEITNRYIVAISDQMTKTVKQLNEEANADAEKVVDDEAKVFYDVAKDSFPAFWKNWQGHEPGTRGAHVSIGGL